MVSVARRPRTLLAVHAHPDDETLTTGGTLARYAAEGVRTVVVTCTRGDLGAVSAAARREPTHSVADLRDRELAAALACLGVARHVQLGYADSGMPGAPENARPGAFHGAGLAEVSERLLAVIREERPHVLIGYDATGGYGHPDHIKAHLAMVAAFEAAEPSVRPSKLYFVRFPLSWSRDVVRSLRQLGIPAPGSAAAGADAGPDVDEIGVADDLVTTAIDVQQYVDIKRAALACHASQLPPDHFLMRMPLDVARRLWAFEWFSLEAGPRTSHRGTRESDLFEALD